ncbi:MAG: TetR/AcrR family transcriptional regulator [Pseudomonadota bacterium]
MKDKSNSPAAPAASAASPVLKVSKASQRKAQLHEDLIACATRRIAAHGAHGLRARDLASDAGCSVGAIYNVFEDLEALILHVSLQTLGAIDEVMAANARERAACSQEEILTGLAERYCDFVVQNTHSWRSLFEHALPEGVELPDWIIEKQISLLGHVRRPLAQLMPTASDEKINSTARLLFSAVHGVVNLAVDQRTVGLALDEVKRELRFLVQMFVAGVEKGRAE